MEKFIEYIFWLVLTKISYMIFIDHWEKHAINIVTIGSALGLLMGIIICIFNKGYHWTIILQAPIAGILIGVYFDQLIEYMKSYRKRPIPPNS